jgi:hypothetical protein
MQLGLVAFAATALLAPTASNALAAPDAVSSENAAESAVLESAERAAKAAEDWELKGESALAADETERHSLEDASKALTAYSSAHPTDERALLLKGRVARAMIITTPTTIKLEDKGGRVTDGDTSQQRADGLAALDKALALEPRNAAAYYWKARILSLQNAGAEQVAAETPFDPKAALDAARMAASLAPADTRYREYLALQLFGTGQTAEALQELRKLPTKHAILQLVDDFDVVPAPASAEPDEERAFDIVSNIFPGHLDAFQYPGLRVRAYKLASSLAEVEAFYSRTFPGVHWAKQKADGGSVFATALLWRENKLEPADDPTPFVDDFQKRLPPSGLLIVVSRDTEAKPARTVLYVVNFRRFSS